MKRLFIAIDIVPGSMLLEAFENTRHTLRMEKISWVNADRMHLTLVFMGDTEEGIIPALAESLAVTLQQHHSFRLTLTGMGVFKNLRDPRVIWTGCEADKELEVLKKDMDSTLLPFGFQPDDRPFHPHLTLGRIKFMRQSNHLAQLIGQYRQTVFQTDSISEVVLYESVLRSTGPEYKVVKKYRLNSADMPWHVPIILF